MNRLLLWTVVTAGSLLAGGCRMCDTCYPIGGLLGKRDTECACEKCTAPPRVGSIIDAPEKLAEASPPFDPSQISGDQAGDGLNAKSTNAKPTGNSAAP